MANLNPMHALWPPKKDRRFAQTPGISEVAVGSSESQRSGLERVIKVNSRRGKR